MASGVLIIGDIPEADDDRSGDAFSGRAGILLDLMLAAIGLSREVVALTTALPWRPPGNRAPTPQELAVLTPFLERQISLIAPRAVVAFGTSVAQMVLGRQDQLLKLRGQWNDLIVDNRSGPLLTTLGPAHLLRHPAQKRYAWLDLKVFQDRLRSAQ
jgi:DNA polymerase